MKKDGITRFKLNAKRPPKTDWRAFDAMSDAERDLRGARMTDARPASTGAMAVPTGAARRANLPEGREPRRRRSFRSGDRPASIWVG